jgi:MYXO-CTERM domain-containing protein
MVKPEDVAPQEPAVEPKAEMKEERKGAETPGTCVVLDEARDSLAAADRRGALTFLRMTFEKKGKTLARDNCTETYTVYHVILGETVTAILEGPGRTVDLKVAGLDELPEAYSQLVTALVEGKEMARATDRKNVTEDQSDPERVKADSLFYFGLGYGALFSNTVHDGPLMTFGYRYELDWIAVDLAMDAPSYDVNEQGGNKATGFAFSLRALYYFDPAADQSPYAGLGLGYALITEEDGDTYTQREGTGLVGRLSLGYEFLRSSTIRLLAQIDATAPMFTLKRRTDFYYDDPATEQADDKANWAPSIGATVGIGWNRPAQRGCSCSTMNDKPATGWVSLLAAAALAAVIVRRRRSC